jgi:hypothetical protein
VIQLGLRPADFWELTQYEYWRLAQRYWKRRDAERIERHNTAALTAFLGIKMKGDMASKKEISLADYQITEQGARDAERDKDEPKRLIQLKNAVAFSKKAAGG